MKHLAALTLLAFLVLGNWAASAQARTYRIAIVTDTLQDFAVKVRDGFTETLDALLAAQGAKAEYRVWDTELKVEKCPAIIDGLKRLAPDLILVINYPTAFADINVTNKLKDSQFRFISMNPVPVQSKTIASWERPGGNVTGISVFLPFSSQIRLMRKIRPEASKLVVYSWQAMAPTNDWYLQEIRRACEEARVTVVDTLLVPDAETEFERLLPYANKGKEYFVFGIISAWVHRDGSAADMGTIEPAFFNSKINIPSIGYDENQARTAFLAGCCVIWGDIGAQAADKGLLVLGGRDPGGLAWEYPRKYNIILNLAVARRLGIVFPQDLINAAYRVYTDLEGHYAGQGN